ncbi:hypothetical protein F5888DRAFT_1634860 [Russula emetica]|nr:hypothetical protein F5888DRAFT_1634860 [Russula emetica]
MTGKDDERISQEQESTNRAEFSPIRRYSNTIGNINSKLKGSLCKEQSSLRTLRRFFLKSPPAAATAAVLEVFLVALEPLVVFAGAFEAVPVEAGALPAVEAGLGANTIDNQGNNAVARFMHLRASPNESVHRTGARGRDRREDDEVKDMVDTERRMDEREGCAFHRDSTVPQEISVVEDGHRGEGRGEAQGDRGGSQGLHPAVGAWLDDIGKFSQIIKERYSESSQKRTGGTK